MLALEACKSANTPSLSPCKMALKCLKNMLYKTGRVIKKVTIFSLKSLLLFLDFIELIFTFFPDCI